MIDCHFRLWVTANGFFMVHMSNLMCTFFPLTLSFSLLFESKDCLKIMPTLVLEQNTNQLPYRVMTLTKLPLFPKNGAYHCKDNPCFASNHMSLIANQGRQILIKGILSFHVQLQNKRISSSLNHSLSTPVFCPREPVSPLVMDYSPYSHKQRLSQLAFMCHSTCCLESDVSLTYVRILEDPN